MASCYDGAVSFLKTEIGRFGDILPRAILPQSVLFGMLPKGTYPVARGRNQQSIRYKPSRPLKTASDYSPMFTGQGFTVCTDSSGPCNPTLKQLGAISDVTSWVPKWAGWKTPKFCHNELITTYDVAEQLANVFSVITDNVKQDIEWEYYFDMIALAENTVTTSGSEGGPITVDIAENYDAPTACPTCPLTLGVLETAIQHGWRRGFMRGINDGGLFGMRNGRPNALLITSAEQSANIVQYDVRARSTDGYRGTYDVQSLFQEGGSKFLSKYGIRSYNGINFLEIPYPRRGTCAVVDGEMVFTPVADSIADPSVPAACDTAFPDGVATIINPDWEDITSAPIEEAILLLRTDIFEIQAWPQMKNPGGDVGFRNLQNFLGQWELVDWRDCNDNPHGLFSYGQALHAYAPKPLQTFGAYKIYFTRCPIAGSCGPCS